MLSIKQGDRPPQLLVLGPAPTFQIVARADRVLVGFRDLGGAMTGFSLRLIGRCSSAISAKAIWNTAGVYQAPLQSPPVCRRPA